ncbi:MAG: hypothetical protein M1819_000829 [Sarea resinae]|nr:MAG: hypothetical protein M1819_000829 [Sarea resinae]
MGLRITTWNVNGIRNPFGYQPWREKRTFDSMFDILEADIVIMQELKIQRKDLRDDMVLVPGWDCYFSLPKYKKGYSGVAIYTRQSVCAPIRAEEGIAGVLCPPGSPLCYRDLPEHECIGGYPTPSQLEDISIDPAVLDSEGRCVVLEFPAFVLFGIYSPANSSGTRDDFRIGFLTALETRVRNLVAQGKRVVVTGDLNVSREEIDTANAEESMKKNGLTREEYASTPCRRLFNQLLLGGKVFGVRDEGREVAVLWDICRGFHEKRKGMFTCWEQKINARPGNYGSRIDYGSDHCPVYATLKDQVIIDGSEVDIRDIMTPTGTFEHGKRLKGYSLKGIPSLSGKLLPEFDRRRTIRDMFGKKPALQSIPSAESAAPPNGNQGPASNGASNASSIADEGTGKVEESQLLETTQQPPPSAPANSSQGSEISTRTVPRKRPSTDTSASRQLKRSKSGASPVKSAPPSKGQKSLMGFFKPKTPDTSTDGSPTAAREDSVKQEDGASPNGRASTLVPTGSQPADKSKDCTLSSQTSQSATQPDSPMKASSPTQRRQAPPRDPEDIIDPVASKETWSKLFTKPAAPRCEGHNEPCRSGPQVRRKRELSGVARRSFGLVTGTGPLELLHDASLPTRLQSLVPTSGPKSQLLVYNTAPSIHTGILEIEAPIEGIQNKAPASLKA